MNVVVMFPYPSGDGLHVGHFYNYAVMDSYCRWIRYHDKVEVTQPFGYDAFGLPAENYAKKIGGDPREVTMKNIDRFNLQMKDMNTMYDTKLVTSDPSYYKWTQWLFTKLHEHGLAYKAIRPQSYCPSCETVLAREQVKEGKCERCDTIVEEKELNQWFFKITDYKERLLKNLEWIDYPEKTKKQQLHWLNKLEDWCVSRQRKWGCLIPIEGETDTLDTFVDSSFYYLRYLTDSDDEFLPMGCYKPVDLYVGGNEHACMHLIYARFIHMFLFDIGIVPQEEPFNKVIHQGMIKYQGEKMSKSKGNVVNPDDYDSDELRFYLMFIGHYFDGGDWSDGHIAGVKRFKNRFNKWINDDIDHGEEWHMEEIDKLKELIDGFIRSFKFNKVVSSFMEFYNKNKGVRLYWKDAQELRKMIECFMPKMFIE